MLYTCMYTCNGLLPVLGKGLLTLAKQKSPQAFITYGLSLSKNKHNQIVMPVHITFLSTQ
ncbi:MAG: hypothetical protein ACRC55_02940, partial [Plesiomonas sp.]